MTAHWKTLVLAIIFCASTSCRFQTEFDSEKWQQELDGTYPYRFQMVDDILTKGFLNGKGESEVGKILGEPSFVDSVNEDVKELGYQIQVAYGWDIDAKYHSNLILTFNVKTKKVIKFEYKASEDRRTWLEKLTSNKY